MKIVKSTFDPLQEEVDKAYLRTESSVTGEMKGMTHEYNPVSRPEMKPIGHAMLRRPQNTHDLVSADFREIQSLLWTNHHKEYSLEYIRKVCKGKRNNFIIEGLSINYIRYMNEALSKMADKLNNRHP